MGLNKLIISNNVTQKLSVYQQNCRFLIFEWYPPLKAIAGLPARTIFINFPSSITISRFHAHVPKFKDATIFTANFFSAVKPESSAYLAPKLSTAMHSLRHEEALAKFCLCIRSF